MLHSVAKNGCVLQVRIRTIGIDGGGGAGKIQETIFFGQLLCKIWAFWGQKSRKIREF